MERLGTRLTFYKAHKEGVGAPGLLKGVHTTCPYPNNWGGGQTKRSGKGKLNSTGFLTVPLSDSLKVWKVLFLEFSQGTHHGGVLHKHVKAFSLVFKIVYLK